MNDADLKPEAPKILKNIKWLRLHGRQYWKIVLIAVIFIFFIFFCKIIFEQFINDSSNSPKISKIQRSIQSSHAAKPRPENGKPPITKRPENSSNNLIDYESETYIFNTLPIDKKIIIDQASKQKYKYSCPDFHPDAAGHFVWLSECEINKFGSIGSLDDRLFYFGLYNFFPQKNDYLNQGVAIFEGNATNDFIKPFIFKVHLDISPQIPSFGYSEPRIFNTEFGKVLALSCALVGGSGGIAYDNDYFFWNGSNWIELDSKKWESDLEKKLPKGLSTLNQLIIDLNDLTVTSELWTAKDAHATPTGGIVKVHLSIKQNRFIIGKLKFLQMGST